MGRGRPAKSDADRRQMYAISLAPATIAELRRLGCEPGETIAGVAEAAFAAEFRRRRRAKKERLRQD